MNASYHGHDIDNEVWALLKPHLPGQRGQCGGIDQDSFPIKSSKSLESKGFPAACSPYPLFGFTQVYPYPGCPYGKKQGQEKPATGYNDEWRSENCDVCASIL